MLVNLPASGSGCTVSSPDGKDSGPQVEILHLLQMDRTSLDVPGSFVSLFGRLDSIACFTARVEDPSAS